MTETASIVVDDRMGVAARLPLVRVLSRPAETFRLASLEVVQGVRITLTRKRKGDLFVWVEWDKDLTDGARLVGQDGSLIALSRGDSLRVGLERPSTLEPNTPIPDVVTLAFQGALRIGDHVRPRVQHTLLSGRVLVVERQPLWGHRFVVSEATLDPGDVASWRTRTGGVATVAGFVHVGAGPALQVTAHGAADHVLVDRFGAKPYEISPSPWSRIGRDPVVANLIIVVTFLAALVTVYELSVRRLRERTRPKP